MWQRNIWVENLFTREQQSEWSLISIHLKNTMSLLPLHSEWWNKTACSTASFTVCTVTGDVSLSQTESPGSVIDAHMVLSRYCFCWCWRKPVWRHPTAGLKHRHTHSHVCLFEHCESQVCSFDILLPPSETGSPTDTRTKISPTPVYHTPCSIISCSALHFWHLVFLNRLSNTFMLASENVGFRLERFQEKLIARGSQ